MSEEIKQKDIIEIISEKELEDGSVEFQLEFKDLEVLNRIKQQAKEKNMEIGDFLSQKFKEFFESGELERLLKEHQNET